MDDDEQTWYKREECIKQQLCELGTLCSIYLKHELLFDPDCSDIVNSFCTNSSLSDESDKFVDSLINKLHEEEIRLGFTLKLLISGNIVEVKCDLPFDYPLESLPNIFVRSTGFHNRTRQLEFRSILEKYFSSLQKGEQILFESLNWICSTLTEYFSANNKPEVKATDFSDSLSRLWIYSHHIYSKAKRRDIISWAEELKLTGFSMSGKPGMICIEGFTEDVDEYWARIKRLNWQRLVIKDRLDKICKTQEEVKSFHIFDVFEEMSFSRKHGRNNNGYAFHSDLGELKNYLLEHGCPQMFELYFGVDIVKESD